MKVGDMVKQGEGLVLKVGDLVKQGDKLVKLKGMKRSEMIGVVVEMTATATDHPIPPKWLKFLGAHKITVLWANGRMTENMAENSLEVVNEDA